VMLPKAQPSPETDTLSPSAEQRTWRNQGGLAQTRRAKDSNGDSNSSSQRLTAATGDSA